VKSVKTFFAALSLMSLLQGTALAQSSPQEQNATPATQDNVVTYTAMGAFNSCILMTKLDQSAAKSIEVSAAMMSNVLLLKHGGLVPENPAPKVPSPLSFEQLMNGSAINIMVSIKSTCFDKLSKANQEFITTNLSNAEGSGNKTVKK